MAKVINLDAGGEVAAHHASTLHEVNAELPSPTVITQIDGNRTEEAPNRFTARLELRSEAIAKRVEVIRSFVAANAQALSNAVTALQESDQLSASAAAQTAAIIDEVATGQPLGGAAAGAAAGGAAGVAASAGSAEGARDVFGRR